MSVNQDDFPMLSDGAVILADAFVERLYVDGMVESDIEYDVADDLHGLAIAAGYGFGKNKELKAIKDYVWQKLGFGNWVTPVIEYPAAESSAPVRRADSPGIIYILHNPSLPNVVKIGFTRRPIECRIRQLSQSTSIPTPFELVKSFASNTPAEHEKAIHAEFALYRMPGREFFRVPESTAIAMCEQVIGGPQ